MENIKEQVISYETAKLAKEKGFNLYQEQQYSKLANPTTLYNYTEGACKLFRDLYYAPTQSFLQTWLRKIHKIDIEISQNMVHDVDSGFIGTPARPALYKHDGTYFGIVRNPNGKDILADVRRGDYEVVREACLIIALNLIKNGN